MRFEWAEAKSEANLTERGFDFAFASLIFDGPTVEVEDRRKEYGERRVVYTDREVPRGQVRRRIISARRSSRHERKVYEKANL